MVHHSFFPIPLENKPIIARCLTGCELHFSLLLNQKIHSHNYINTQKINQDLLYKCLYPVINVSVEYNFS